MDTDLNISKPNHTNSTRKHVDEFCFSLSTGENFVTNDYKSESQKRKHG